ncbi:MSCRAMM family protein, partial [Clostridium perfringens]
ISLNDLAPGDYQFVETKAPDGYELDTTPVKFTIVVGQKEAIKIEKVNDPNQVELKISKVDKENAKPLEGAEFEIFSINDIKNPLKFRFSNLYQKYEFNNQGDSTLKANNSDSSFTINKLGYGDYILKEIKAPNGYKLGKDIYIHLDSNNSYYKVGEDGKNINLDKNESLNLYEINVENEKGIVLPETGGNGFIFQRNVAILILVISFFLIINLLINKKRRFN